MIDGVGTSIVLDRYNVCADICGLYLCSDIGRALAMNKKKDAIRGLWQSITQLLAFTAHTAVGIAYLAVLEGAAIATRRLNQWCAENGGIPEIAWLFKAIELFLLAAGVWLFVASVIANTRDQTRRLFPGIGAKIPHAWAKTSNGEPSQQRNA